MQKSKKSIALVVAMVLLTGQISPTVVLAVPSTIPANSSYLQGEWESANTGMELNYPVGLKISETQIKYQLVAAALKSIGIKVPESIIYNYDSVPLPMKCLWGNCTDSVSVNDTLQSIILDSILNRKNIPASAAGQIFDSVFEGSNTATIEVDASTIGDLTSKIEQQIGLGIPIGQNGSGGINAGLPGGGGILDSGGWQTNTTAPDSVLGNLGGVLGGSARQISDNASYTVEINGPQYINASLQMDPPNPLKNKAVTFKAEAIPTPPPGGQIIPDKPIQIETVTYTEAGMFNKEFTFGYTYVPPCIPTTKGCYQPPSQRGTLKVTSKFRVSEFNSYGSGGAVNDGSYGNAGQQPGGGSIMSSGPSLTVNNGGVGPSNMLLGQTAKQPMIVPGAMQSAVGGINDAARNILSGDIPFPFGTAVNGVSNSSTPNINISIPGLGNIGSGMYSLADGIHNLLRGTDAPKNTNGVAEIPKGTNIQSNQTPDQVRQENFGNMTNILKTAATYLAVKGVKPNEIAKMYDPDSVYTSPNEAWDMNRLTRFMDNKSLTDN